MFATVEEHYHEVALQDNTRQIPPAKIDALMNSLHDTFHYFCVTGDMAFLSSEIRSLRLCQYAEHVSNTLRLK